MNDNDPDPTSLSEASLREAAVNHLARYAATEAGLARVLARRIDRWATRARRTGEREAIAGQVSAAKALIALIVSRLAHLGAIDDARFASSRSRSLSRAGRSARAIEARLITKGVPKRIAREAVAPDPARELGACLMAAKKRRMGPFRTREDSDPARERAALARAGFTERTVREAFGLSSADADEALRRWREQVEQ